jgi:hypothetical protein
VFQNGIEAYAAWMSFISVINVAIALQYDNEDYQLQASLAPLCALLACVVIWFPVENCAATVELLVRYGCVHYAGEGFFYECFSKSCTRLD